LLALLKKRVIIKQRRKQFSQRQATDVKRCRLQAGVGSLGWMFCQFGLGRAALVQRRGASTTGPAAASRFGLRCRTPSALHHRRVLTVTMSGSGVGRPIVASSSATPRCFVPPRPARFPPVSLGTSQGTATPCELINFNELILINECVR